MARLETGSRVPETRGGRLSLQTWRPRSRSKLSGGEQIQDSHEADDTQRFEAWLYQARNVWSVDRHRLPTDAEGWLSGRGIGDRRIDKRDANRLWDAAKAAFAKEHAR